MTSTARSNPACRRRPVAGSLLLLTCLAAASAALGADAAGQYAVKGAGIAACADYLAARERGDERAVFMYAGWADGFITAANLYEEDTFDIAPWQDADVLAALLGNACRRKPEAAFHLAVAEVMRGIFPARLETTSPRVTIEAGERDLVLYASIVERARGRLVELDYLEAGAAKDAGWDADAADAIARFQADRELEVTRVPDRLTLLYLFTAGEPGR